MDKDAMRHGGGGAGGGGAEVRSAGVGSGASAHGSAGVGDARAADTGPFRDARADHTDPAQAMALTALYVPGDRPERVAKALNSGADIVIVDLEDAVAASAKEGARASASAALTAAAELAIDPLAGAELSSGPSVQSGIAGRRRFPPRIQVRVNAPDSPWHDDDLAMVAALPGDIGVRVPKVSGAETVARVRARLGAHSGFIASAEVCEVHALIETALGVERAFEIAMAGVASLALGEADLRSELALPAGLAGEPGLAWLRSRVVNAAAAAGLVPPMMSVFADVRDLDGLAASCQAGRALGFCGRTAIHPAQLPAIREAFLPTTAEVERARAIVDRIASASAAGSGTVVLDDGTFLDIAMVRAARRTLALAGEATGEAVCEAAGEAAPADASTAVDPA